VKGLVCPICEEGKVAVSFSLSGGERRTAQGRVCYDADPERLPGTPFPEMFVLRVDPRGGNRIYLMFRTKNDLLRFGKFKAGEQISFKGCFHNALRTRHGRENIRKGPMATMIPKPAASRTIVLDVTYIGRVDT
jgi:hypothetical protein